jgi:hypothetical protein
MKNKKLARGLNQQTFALLFLLLLLSFTSAFSQGSIGGVAWLDQNRNGLRENSERGFSGIKVVLMKKMAETFFVKAGEYETESNGRFIFIVQAAEYYLQFARPDGYVFCAANVGVLDEFNSNVDAQNGQTAVFKLENQQNVIYLDAGYIQSGGADVVINKTVLRDKVLIGREYSYLIKIKNNGPDQAINVAIQTGLSPVVELVKTEPTPEDTSARPLRWFLPLLPVGDSFTIDITVRSLSSGTDDSRCCVSTTSNDPDPSNNCDALTIDVDLPVELTLFQAISATGGVKVLWSTASETENAGFTIYRSSAWDGLYERINPELINGQGSTPTRHNYEYLDKNVQLGSTYYYKLTDMDYQGRVESHGPTAVTVSEPKTFQLQQNYPNPFNSETRIPFVLEESGAVRLDIYNILGQKIRVLVDAEMTAGEHVAAWDGLNDQGLALTTGVYYYVLQSLEGRQTRKMHLVR